MNIYDENLKRTVIATLSDFENQNDKLQSALRAATYSLYYAQGAEMKARDKLYSTNGVVDACRVANDQSRTSANQMFNLQASVSKAKTNVDASNSNMATAASNVQIAANAIVALASEMGAALNGAYASLYQSNVYDKIKDANSFISEVANNARHIADEAMKVSSDSSEIIATAALAAAGDAKSRIGNLYSATQAELDKFSAIALAEGKTLGLAAVAERQAEGVMADGLFVTGACELAYLNANAQLNLGLTVTVNSASAIQVVFQPLDSILPPVFDAQPAGVTMPDLAPQYYLALVPEERKGSFAGDIAQQIFVDWNALPTPPPPIPMQFQAVSPALLGVPPPFLQLTCDAFGKAIKPGGSYVAFLYVVLSKEYKFFIGDYSDWVSAPSLPFTLATPLPSAVLIEIQMPGIMPSPMVPPPVATVTFIAGQLMPVLGNNTQPEFRCILVDQQIAAAESSMDPTNRAGPQIAFNLDIAMQVAPANYTLAVPLVQDIPAPIPDLFIASFSLLATDNFGNLLDPAKLYTAYVLTVMPQDTAGQYASVLQSSVPPSIAQASTVPSST